MAKKKKVFDFEKISKGLAELEEKQHIDQIAPALSDAFFSHAKFTDENGVEQFKTSYTRKEAEALGDELYDTLAYHSHRRVFGIGKEDYEKLKGFKDKNGTAYIDGITEYHFGLKRAQIRRHLGQKKENNKINAKTIDEIVQPAVKHHGNLLQQGYISKEGLDKPEHADAVKKAIGKIKDKYKLGIDMDELNTPDGILGAYVQISEAHYAKGAH